MTSNDKKMVKVSDKDFIKLYRNYIANIAELGRQSPGALCVFLFLIRNMDGNNAIGITMEAISEYVNLSRQTVSKHLRYLEENGWIQSFRICRNKIYVVNDSIAWTSYGVQRSNCLFNNTLQLERMYMQGDPWDTKILAKRSHTRFIEKRERKER